MEKVMLISELLGTDVRSRSNAEIIRADASNFGDTVILDFKDVTFVSRSFADELCSIMETCGNISLVHMSRLVESMMNAVSSGRKEKRLRPDAGTDIKDIDTIEDLSEFFSSI